MYDYAIPTCILTMTSQKFRMLVLHKIRQMATSTRMFQHPGPHMHLLGMPILLFIPRLSPLNDVELLLARQLDAKRQKYSKLWRQKRLSHCL